MNEIETSLKNDNITEAIKNCMNNKLLYIAYFFAKTHRKDNEEISELCKYLEEHQTTQIVRVKKSRDTKKVLLLCNWTTSEELCKTWNKMSKNNDFTWDDIEIVWENKNIDYYVVINKPLFEDVSIKPEKTIIFRMEPYMEKRKDIWGDWSEPDKDKFMKVCYHDDYYNNLEWHLGLTYNELIEKPITKTEDTVSVILSSKYSDPGHVLRVDFINYIEEDGEIVLDVFGDPKFDYRQYKGRLPYHNKNKGLLPYKYTFNAENNDIPNYITEKLIDGILAECLTFYWGSFSAKELIDEKAFVLLDLTNFEKSLNIIKQAIKEDWWSQRIEYIRNEKKRILNELQFFPRVKQIIDEHEKESA